jgi:hypothetical protein
MSTQFSDGLRDYGAELEQWIDDVRIGSANEAFRSVVHGSEITGAPGQPVGGNPAFYPRGYVGGTLLNSFQLEHGEDVSEISTNIIYAPGIEDGVGPHGPITIRSEVGGTGSVSATVSAFDRIVDHVVAEFAR